MSTLLAVLATLAFLAGAAGWVVAAWAGIGVFAMTPRGSRWAVYRRLGWWRHHEIAGLVGPAAQPRLALMRRGALVFVASACAGIVLMLLANLPAA